MKKTIALVLALCLTIGIFAGCNTTNEAEDTTAAETTVSAQSASAPKYVFLFIGDGMSSPQIQSTADYLGAERCVAKITAVDGSSTALCAGMMLTKKT